MAPHINPRIALVNGVWRAKDDVVGLLKIPLQWYAFQNRATALVFLAGPEMALLEDNQVQLLQKNPDATKPAIPQSKSRL